MTTTEQAIAYHGRILQALAKAGGNADAFTPLMTLYLTDNTSGEEIFRAHESGQVYAVKLYPAGATTNSDAGVTDLLGNARKRWKRWKNAACPCWCMAKSRTRPSMCSIARRCSSSA